MCGDEGEASILWNGIHPALTIGKADRDA
jgi:hypothetical protein